MPDKQWFKGHLAKQLGFLRRSCESYDQGYKDEAIRIATVLRVLMHDTTDRKGRPRSVSLLTHLKVKDKIWLRSTCYPSPEGAIEYHGMGRRTVNVTEDLKASTKFEPVLDDEAHPHIGVSVQDWWEMVVYVSSAYSGPKILIPPPESTVLRRKDIVLAAANKDGGAHVDEKLTPEYERLLSPLGAGIMNMNIDLIDGRTVRPEPIMDTHLVYMRQKGYEVLESPSLYNLLSIYN